MSVIRDQRFGSIYHPFTPTESGRAEAIDYSASTSTRSHSTASSGDRPIRNRRPCIAFENERPSGEARSFVRNVQPVWSLPNFHMASDKLRFLYLLRSYHRRTVEVDFGGDRGKLVHTQANQANWPAILSLQSQESYSYIHASLL